MPLFLLQTFVASHSNHWPFSVMLMEYRRLRSGAGRMRPKRSWPGPKQTY